MSGRPLTFTLSVAGKVLRRSLRWEEIARLKERIKRFARWDSASRAWVASPEDVARAGEEAMQVLHSVFGAEGLEIYNTIISEDRENRLRMLDRGVLLLLPRRYISDYSVYRAFSASSRPHPTPLAGSTAKYYVLDPGRFLASLLGEGVDVRGGPRSLEAILHEIDPLVLEEQVRYLEGLAKPVEGDLTIVDGGMRGAIIVFRDRPAPHIVERLREACRVTYYVSKPGEQGVELEPRELVFIQQVSDTSFRVPYFSIPEVKKLAEDLGLRIADRVEWPRGRIAASKDAVQLYDFQREALEAWRSSGGRGTIVMPTGGGKTFIALAAIAEMSYPTLVCVTTLELARQWARRLREYLGLPSSILAGGSRDVGSVTVATYHSAARNLEAIYNRFNLVVFDEGHHLPAETFKEIALKIKAEHFMVLSATPERADRNEALIYKVAGGVVYSVSYLDLVLKGVLAPLKVEKVYVRLTPEEESKYRRVEHTPISDLRRTTLLIKLACQASRKLDALKTILRHEEGRVLVFCQFLEQARAAYDAAREVEPRTELITGSTPKGQRLRAFEKFSRGDVRVLVATTVLDEGVDVPDADVAVILSGSGQIRQMIQRGGRVLRWTPGKIAKIYEVVARDTIEEALSNSRSIFKVIDAGEARTALELATWAYQQMQELIDRYRKAGPAEKAAILRDAREAFTSLVSSRAKLAALPF